MGYGNTYKGKYRPKDVSKYAGDANDVVYRSQWEKWAFLWCDKNPDVEFWNSESVIVPYYDNATKKNRRYFIDLFIQFRNGSKYLVEIKPYKETQKPKNGKGRARSKVLKESMTYITNTCKWNAATEFALDNNAKFIIWTERELKSMGIMKF